MCQKLQELSDSVFSRVERRRHWNQRRVELHKKVYSKHEQLSNFAISSLSHWDKMKVKTFCSRAIRWHNTTRRAELESFHSNPTKSFFRHQKLCNIFAIRAKCNLARSNPKIFASLNFLNIKKLNLTQSFPLKFFKRSLRKRSASSWPDSGSKLIIPAATNLSDSAPAKFGFKEFSGWKKNCFINYFKIHYFNLQRNGVKVKISSAKLPKRQISQNIRCVRNDIRRSEKLSSLNPVFKWCFISVLSDIQVVEVYVGIW